MIPEHIRESNTGYGKQNSANHGLPGVQSEPYLRKKQRLPGSPEEERALAREPYYTTKMLAKRWCLTRSTLDHWRVSGKGPLHIKIEGGIRYLVKDVELYELENCRQSTSTPQGFFSLQRSKEVTMKYA